jgi:hypothetical protein
VACVVACGAFGNGGSYGVLPRGTVDPLRRLGLPPNQRKDAATEGPLPAGCGSARIGGEAQGRIKSPSRRAVVVERRVWEEFGLAQQRLVRRSARLRPGSAGAVNLPSSLAAAEPAGRVAKKRPIGPCGAHLPRPGAFTEQFTPRGGIR